MFFQRKNLIAIIEWRLYMLITNFVVWNLLLRLFIILNYIINPDLYSEGPRIFQLLAKNPFLIITGFSSIVAVGTWLIEDIFFYKHFTHRNIGLTFLLRLLIGLASTLIIMIIVGIYHYQANKIVYFMEYWEKVKAFLINRTALYLILVIILISIFLNFTKAIIQKVGYENFFKIIVGYYRKPKEEERIFIFIDLISSTKYAERLGHIKYSKFIQECFRYLGILEIKYKAMQYQFVGDEVVLSWTAKKKRNYLNAVGFFFEFISILEDKSETFIKNFGVLPEFSASINSGKIMVSEVGTIKSEIAFHGDVLNTAARIQKQCKSLNRRLLVTKTFAQVFAPIAEYYKVEWLCNKILLGKKLETEIFAIDPKIEF